MRSFVELKAELDNNGLKSIPNISGYYLVWCPLNLSVQIREKTDAVLTFSKDGKEKDLLYPKILLEKKMELIEKIPDNNRYLFYIGKADRKSGGLRDRIIEFVRYGYGKCKTHRGGRAIWQIENNKDLLLEWIPCENSEAVEKKMLKEYKKKYTTYPLANWRS